MLACAEGGLVEGCGCGGAGCGEKGGRGVYGLGVTGVGVDLLDGGFFGLGEVGESNVDVVAEVLQCARGRGTQGNAFVGHVAGEDAHTFYGFAGKLLAGALLDESTVCYREEGESAEGASLRDSGTGVLHDDGVGTAEALELVDRV